MKLTRVFARLGTHLKVCRDGKTQVTRLRHHIPLPRPCRFHTRRRIRIANRQKQPDGHFRIRSVYLLQMVAPHPPKTLETAALLRTVVT